MPRIFDNIDERLLPALRETLDLCHRGDPLNLTIGYLGSSNLTFAGLYTSTRFFNRPPISSTGNSRVGSTTPLSPIW